MIRTDDPVAPMVGGDERAEHLRMAVFVAIHQALAAERSVSGALDGVLMVEAVLAAAAAVLGQQVAPTGNLDEAIADFSGLFGGLLQTEICASWAREWAA